MDLHNLPLNLNVSPNLYLLRKCLLPSWKKCPPPKSVSTPSCVFCILSLPQFPPWLLTLYHPAPHCQFLSFLPVLPFGLKAGSHFQSKKQLTNQPTHEPASQPTTDHPLFCPSCELSILLLHIACFLTPHTLGNLYLTILIKDFFNLQ